MLCWEKIALYFEIHKKHKGLNTMSREREKLDVKAGGK